MALERSRNLITTIAVLLCGICSAQSPSPSVGMAPQDISKWDLICFCITSVNTPHFAVRADTNGQILYFARNGATKVQLQQQLGIPVLSSQLGLLIDWRLLKRSGDVYTSNIPILGPEKIDQLREQTSAVAVGIAAEIHPELSTIASELERRHLSQSLYAVLFSYVLDGLTWDKLRSAEAIPAMQITADHPFWDGTFWAVYPKRDAAPGTNSTETDGTTLLMTWTDPVSAQLNGLQSSVDLNAVLRKVARGECGNLGIEDKEHRKWHLGRADGSCVFPVIHENASEPIYVAGRRIADRIAKAVLENDMQKLIGGGATAQQARLIEGHELMWEVLNALIRQGVVQQPAVLRSKPEDTASLMPLLVVTVQQ